MAATSRDDAPLHCDNSELHTVARRACFFALERLYSSVEAKVAQHSTHVDLIAQVWQHTLPTVSSWNAAVWQKYAEEWADVLHRIQDRSDAGAVSREARMRDTARCITRALRDCAAAAPRGGYSVHPMLAKDVPAFVQRVFVQLCEEPCIAKYPYTRGDAAGFGRVVAGVVHFAVRSTAKQHMKMDDTPRRKKKSRHRKRDVNNSSEGVYDASSAARQDTAPRRDGVSHFDTTSTASVTASRRNDVSSRGAVAPRRDDASHRDAASKASVAAPRRDDALHRDAASKASVAAPRRDDVSRRDTASKASVVAAPRRDDVASRGAVASCQDAASKASVAAPRRGAASKASTAASRRDAATALSAVLSSQHPPQDARTHAAAGRATRNIPAHPHTTRRASAAHDFTTQVTPSTRARRDAATWMTPKGADQASRTGTHTVPTDTTTGASAAVRAGDAHSVATCVTAESVPSAHAAAWQSMRDAQTATLNAHDSISQIPLPSAAHGRAAPAQPVDITKTQVARLSAKAVDAAHTDDASRVSSSA